MMLPPLVPPDATLSAAEVSRYSRHILIPEVGMTGQQRLKCSRVLVIGAGGLGSPVLLYLAAAGVGTLGVVDFDRVEDSNLQRQVIHRVSGLGSPKAESAARAIAELNPWVKVEPHLSPLTVDNARALIADYDMVIDGTDNFATRYLINDACVLAQKPYVWGSIYRFEGQASVFWEQAPGGVGLNYRDLYPAPPPPELAPSCSEGGVLGIVCASIGAIMATEAVKLITGVGDSLLGRLAVYDALDMSLRFLPLRRDPARQPIVALGDYQALCGQSRASAAEEEAVPSLSASELQALFASGERFTLLDVRERTEWDMVRIDGARHVPRAELANPAVLADLDKDSLIVLQCKLGARSRQALHTLRAQGFTQLKNLEGGILAWIEQIEPHLPRY